MNLVGALLSHNRGGHMCTIKAGSNPHYYQFRSNTTGASFAVNNFLNGFHKGATALWLLC